MKDELKLIELIRSTPYFVSIDFGEKIVSIDSAPNNLIVANKCKALNQLKNKFGFSVQYAIK